MGPDRPAGPGLGRPAGEQTRRRWATTAAEPQHGDGGANSDAGSFRKAPRTRQAGSCHRRHRPTPCQRRPSREVGPGPTPWRRCGRTSAGSGPRGPLWAGGGGRGRLAPLGRATPANQPGVGDAPLCCCRTDWDSACGVSGLPARGRPPGPQTPGGDTEAGEGAGSLRGTARRPEHSPAAAETPDRTIMVPPRQLLFKGRARS